jgi:hypothetical protein
MEKWLKTGNCKDDKYTRQTKRTQMLDGNSEKDVTVEDMGELSRSPKYTRTVHVVSVRNCTRRIDEF